MECEIPQSIKEISILLTNDEDIRILNRDYRKKDKATDILSFSQLEGENSIEPQTLGDLVISTETAKVQAKKYQHSLMKEMTRLIIHGTLHLLGYDHEKVSQSTAQKMRRKEKAILKDFSYR